MFCPKNPNKDFDYELCKGCEWALQCYNAYQTGNIFGDNFPKIPMKYSDNLPSFIINGVCEKDDKTICNIGYACDGCPYNPEDKIKQQIIDSVRTIGESHTWYCIESISDYKIRIKHRLTFLKLGYKIPERND